MHDRGHFYGGTHPPLFSTAYPRGGGSGSFGNVAAGRCRRGHLDPWVLRALGYWERTSGEANRPECPPQRKPQRGWRHTGAASRGRRPLRVPHPLDTRGEHGQAAHHPPTCNLPFTYVRSHGTGAAHLDHQRVRVLEGNTTMACIWSRGDIWRLARLASLQGVFPVGLVATRAR